MLLPARHDPDTCRCARLAQHRGPYARRGADSDPGSPEARSRLISDHSVFRRDSPRFTVAL
ncbi:hypothetical protein DP43_5131 [Burkholderia pseudomallei]|nr:hypothetical protein DP43_5131 [Burkholderia pseudomallei]